MATWRLKSDWSQTCEVQSTGEAVVPPGLRYVRVPGCCPSKTASPVGFLVPYDFLALFWEPVPEPEARAPVPEAEVWWLVEQNAKLAAQNLRLRERNDLLREQNDLLRDQKADLIAKNHWLGSETETVRRRNAWLIDRLSQLSATLDKVRSAAGGCGA